MTILYHHPMHAHSRRIRLLLNEFYFEYRLQHHHFWQRSENLLALNPAGNLPVLVTAEHATICGARPIAEFIYEIYLVS